MTLDRRTFLAAVTGAALVAGASRAWAELVPTLTIGVVRGVASAPLYIAQARSYFKSNGVDVAFIPFNSEDAIATSVAAGSVDLGLVPLSAAFFKLAARDDLRIIGGGALPAPGGTPPPRLTALVTTRALIQQHPNELRHVCDAYRHGVEDYQAAFFSGKPGAAADAVIPLVASEAFLTGADARAKILAGVEPWSPGGAIDVKRIEARLASLREQKKVPSDVSAQSLIDTSFLPPANG